MLNRIKNSLRGGGTAGGFTLAEVLVTLGIIGVVSAMTLPTLVKNHQRQVFVTQLHKVYNDLTQAFERVIIDNNASNLKESKLYRQGVPYFFQNYFKVVKDCYNGVETANCVDSTNYTTLLGSATSALAGFDGDYSCVILQSGALVCLQLSGDYFTGISGLVDVNGFQPPNIKGRDLFDMRFDENGELTTAWGKDISTAAGKFADDCEKDTTSGATGACIARIIDDGWKMEY